MIINGERKRKVERTKMVIQFFAWLSADAQKRILKHIIKEIEQTANPKRKRALERMQAHFKKLYKGAGN